MIELSLEIINFQRILMLIDRELVEIAVFVAEKNYRIR
jgi:hypothetical protein